MANPEIIILLVKGAGISPEPKDPDNSPERQAALGACRTEWGAIDNML